MNTKPLYFAEINSVTGTPSNSVVYTTRHMFRHNRAITGLYTIYKTVKDFNWSHPDEFSLKYSRVCSFKTQLIYCQLQWRHVSTQKCHHRANYRTMFRVYQELVQIFGIPKYLQDKKHGYEKVDIL